MAKFVASVCMCVCVELLFVAYKFYRFSTPSSAAAKYPGALYAKFRLLPSLAHM